MKRTVQLASRVPCITI